MSKTESELRAKLVKAEALLDAVVMAWETLPGGNHPIRVVEDWLEGTMADMIYQVRKHQKEREHE